MRRLAIGIDIGGTRTKIGLVDLFAGEVIKCIIELTEKDSARAFEQNMERAIEGLIRIANKEPVNGIGVGVSGFVWPNGKVDSTYGFIPFMEDYPLAEIIQSKFAIPCKIDNDARTIALGEALYGQGKGYKRMLMITLGTGLGIGVTHDAKLVEQLPYAHMGGHIVITQNDLTCYCGKNGCLESLVSATGILIAGRRAGLKGDAENPLTVENIFEASNREDALAGAVVRQWLSFLKTGIANYVNIYAPDMIVLGGGVSKGLKNYVPFLEDINFLKPYKKYKVKISISELEEHSGILGSAALFS